MKDDTFDPISRRLKGDQWIVGLGAYPAADDLSEPLISLEIIDARHKAERAALEAAGASATALEEFDQHWAGTIEEAHRLNAMLSRLR